jgi:hypothetical protein
VLQGLAEAKNRLFKIIKGIRGIRVKASTLTDYVKQRYHADMARPSENKWTGLTEAMQAMPDPNPEISTLTSLHA